MALARTRRLSSTKRGGHPLYKHGLRHYAFYEVEHSRLVDALMRQNRVHPRHSDYTWKAYRHWIATFHDETLEVVGDSVGVGPAIEARSGAEALAKLLEAQGL